MVPSLLASLLLVPLARQAHPDPGPHDLVVELELTGDSPVLVEGRGPTAAKEYAVDFTGTLHVWTRSELDLALRVDDASAWTMIAEDDDSGGGTTPYVMLSVRAGDLLVVMATASNPQDLGSLWLHLVAAPETEATLDAAAAGSEELEEVQRLQDEGAFEEARDLVEHQVVRLLEVPGAGDSHALPTLLAKLGRSALAVGQLQACRMAWEAALQSFERFLPPEHHELLVLQGNLATVRYDQGDLAGARALQESVLAARERTVSQGHPELCTARQNLANTLFLQGDLAGSRALHQTVLEERERTLPRGHPDVLGARQNLGAAMSVTGELAGARALQESVLAELERTLPEEHADLLQARLNLAFTMGEMGDQQGARALEESVLAARERVLPDDHPDVLHARQNLAGTMLEMGDLSAARTLQEQVLEARERTLPDDHIEVLLARLNLAATKKEMGESAGARTLYESVLVACEKTLPPDHPVLLATRRNLAVTVGAMGDLSRARMLFESVLQEYERLLPDHPDVLATREGLAETLRLEGDLAGALELVPAQVSGMQAWALRSLSLAPREAREAVAGEARRLGQLLALTRSARPELQAAVFELQETMRMVSGEAARALRATQDPDVRALLTEATQVREALNATVSTGTDQGAEQLSSVLTRLLRERDRLEHEASRLLSERGVASRPIAVDELARGLGSDAVLVAYRRTSGWDVPGDRLLVHVLDSDGALTRIDLGEATELEELVTGWRDTLGAPLRRGITEWTELARREKETGEALRARLLDPVLAALGAEPRRLFVCPDDLVHLVPLDALPLGSGRVGDRWSLSSEVSCARLGAPDPASTGEPGLLAMGGVVYDAREDAGAVVASATTSRHALPARFPPLLQTLFEVETVAALFEGLCGPEPTLLTKRETTREALFLHAPGKRYVHLATHGWFASEAIRSTLDVDSGKDWSPMGVRERIHGMAPMLLCGLAFSGANQPRDSRGRRPGILTAEELCSLDLGHCELAVLSACETNVGIRRAGQGIQSLQAALYAAGARSSITSLWKVDDAATRRLMELFYTGLWEQELPKARALWEAKRALRDEGAPVRDWAGWVLTGDPD